MHGLAGGLGRRGRREPSGDGVVVHDTPEDPPDRDSDDAPETADATMPQPDRSCPSDRGAPAAGDELTLLDVDGVSISVALYEVPHDEGNPWSQWSQGVVLPDGRFVSGVGDHLGRDGDSWFYEYDPSSNTLARTASIAEPLGHETGDWGYGKLHAQMVLGPCDEVITASYWGSRRGLELGGSYRGDHLLRYDPASRTVESLGVPVEGHGIPSLAISTDRRWVYGEAVDPESEPDAGVFFVADSTTGEVVFTDDELDHVGFRSILVGPDGSAYYSANDNRLARWSPDDGSLSIHPHEMPGRWLRAATPPAPDGTVYGATRSPDRLFRMNPDGTIDDLGEAAGYIASLGMSPDGSTLYYVPDAHGGSARTDTPLYAVDTATGDQRVVVRMNPAVESELGVRLGGSYNVVADPSGERVFIGMNASEVDSEEPDRTFGTVVLLVVELP